MDDALGVFHFELLQEVHVSADAEGEFLEDSFFDYFCGQLIEAGEIDTADRVHYRAPRGMRIDGYAGDPQDSDGILTLLIVDFDQSEGLNTLTATEMNAIFKRASNFLSRSLVPNFSRSLEETSPVFGLANLIETRWNTVAKIRLLLISNRVLSERVDGRVEEELQGIPITYNVWDLGRLHRFVSSGQNREDIEIDLAKEFGGPLKVLPADEQKGYKAFLAVIPGLQLAKIYDRWGARLLEQNVRVFLQARNKVNRGIRITLENTPGLFFAYNNGITATATEIETIQSNQGLELTKLRNFQIVNGGQTTASIHLGSRNKNVDLSNVFVPMKLSVVEPKQAEDIVPKISEFANSQNRVNAADFFSNHPYHIRIEEFSRRIYVPSPEGSFRESKWFYERARGQFQDTKAARKESERRRIDLEFPRRQMFTKTDLAKFINVWDAQPHIVSRGAQKNFADFAKRIGKEWDRKSEIFNESYYRQLVSKAIVFRKLEQLVMKQTWYGGGYRANVVAYAISKLALDIKQLRASVNFERIWRVQGTFPELDAGLLISAEAVHDIITDIPPNISNRNVTEWAKQQACWNRVQKLVLNWPQIFLESLIPEEELVEQRKSAIKNQKELNGIEAQTAVVAAGGEFWTEVKQWGEMESLLSFKEASILDLAARVSHRIPTEKQCLVAMSTLRNLQSEGCPIDLT